MFKLKMRKLPRNEKILLWTTLAVTVLCIPRYPIGAFLILIFGLLLVAFIDSVHSLKQANTKTKGGKATKSLNIIFIVLVGGLFFLPILIGYIRWFFLSIF